MADTEFSALVAQLAERTAQGKVNWKGTSNDNEFVIYFRQFSLAMRRGISGEDDSFIVFSLRNDGGKKVDEFYVWERSEEWDEADQMWLRARRRVLRIDEVIESLLGELKGGGEIGEEPKSPDEEDLPF